jgi:hypothetical protein
MVLNPKAFEPPLPPPKTTLVPGVAWDTTIKPTPRKKQVRIKQTKQLNIDPLAEAREQLAEIKRKKNGK